MADEGHYRGRIKRLENWQEISKIVTHKLSKLTMICILDEARLEIFQKLEAKERIPCSMYWVDVVFLYCFHLLERKKISNPAFNCTIGDKIHDSEIKKN